MATAKYGPVVIEKSPFSGSFDLKVTGKGSAAVYTDTGTGADISFYGDKLKAGSDNASDTLISGSVEKIIYQNGEGATLVTITGDYKAKALSLAFDKDGLVGLAQTLFKGDDKMAGSKLGDSILGYAGKDDISGGKGDDKIFGGSGDDIMRGGTGSDIFAFVKSDKGVDHDTILDFDLEGNEIDFLSLDGEEISSIKGANKNHDTLLSFDDGSTILLNDVTRNDFEAYHEIYH